MSVPVQDTVFTYTANGSTSSFAYECYIIEAGDLVVYQNDEVAGGYTVTGVGNASGGDVIFPSNPVAGTVVRIERDVDVKRDTQYQILGDFRSPTVNNDFDRIWMVLQRIAYYLGFGGMLSRVLRLGDGDVNGSGAYRAQQNRIRDVGDPTADQDAVNWRTMFTFVTGYVEQAIAGVVGGFGNFLQAGIGAIVRTFQSKMRDTISVRDYISTAIDGVTSNQAGIEAAVAYAYTIGAFLDWPPGTYVSDANIPNFQDVRHTGAGILKRGADLFYLSPSEADNETNTIYVSPTGNNANDGLTAALPIQTMARANAVLVRWCNSGMSGKWRVVMAAGNYDRLALNGDLRNDVIIEVLGPATGGSPNVPTANLDGGGTGRGIDIPGDVRIRFLDVHVKNCGTAMVNNGGNVTWENVHISNCTNGVTNLNGKSLFTCQKGGVWDGNGLGGDGLETFYGAQHAMDQATSNPAAGALVIKNFGRGLLINEGAQGHLDNINVTDCSVAGMNIKRGAGAVNPSGMVLKRNAIGVLAENNAWYENGLVFGAGADANGENVRTVGVSPELRYATETNRMRNILQVETSGLVSLTGTVAKTLLYTSPTIPVWVFSTQSGHVHKMRIFGTFAAPLVGTATVGVEMNNGTIDGLCGDVVLPAGTELFDIECVTYKSTVNTHHSFIRGLVNGATPILGFRNFGFGLVGLTSTIRAYCTLSNAADSFQGKFILESSHAG